MPFSATTLALESDTRYWGKEPCLERRFFLAAFVFCLPFHVTIYSSCYFEIIDLTSQLTLCAAADIRGILSYPKRRTLACEQATKGFMNTEWAQSISKNRQSPIRPQIISVVKPSAKPTSGIREIPSLSACQKINILSLNGQNKKAFIHLCSEQANKGALWRYRIKKDCFRAVIFLCERIMASPSLGGNTAPSPAPWTSVDKEKWVRLHLVFLPNASIFLSTARYNCTLQTFVQ